MLTCSVVKCDLIIYNFQLNINILFSDNHPLVVNPAVDIPLLSVRASVQRILHHLLRTPESVLGSAALDGNGRVLASRDAHLRSRTLAEVSSFKILFCSTFSTFREVSF